MKILGRSLFYLVIAAWCLVNVPSSASARIPSVAFKGVTKYFKPGKEFYSPTLGITAIETGLIYNLRFYGNYTAVYNNYTDNRGINTLHRIYVNDTSHDPVWKLTHILFPSSAGNLTPETESFHNFGKHVISARTVALILDYTHQLRFKGIYTPPQPQQGPGPIPKQQRASREITVPTNLRLPLKKFKEMIGERVLTPSSQQQMQINQNAPHIALEGEQIETYVRLKQSQFSHSKQTTKTQPSKIDPIPLLSQMIFNSLNVTDTTHKENLKKNINALLHTIKEAILYEKDSLYPSYTTEQIILAFFCEKFNYQQDIWHLIKELANLDTHQEMIQRSDALDVERVDLLQESDLKNLATNPQPDLDDLYLLANADIFYRIIPYKDGIEPISNGSTYPYDRIRNAIDQTTTFPDCIESLIRHICNLFLYNFSIKDFDLSVFDKTNPYVENLVNFYKHQNSLLANNGDIKIRSLWNKVIGDLNDGQEVSGLRVVYSEGSIRGSYNLFPGYINLIAVFQKLLPLETLVGDSVSAINPKNASLEDATKWVEAYMTALFETLKPEYVYGLDTSKLQLQEGYNGPDVFGDLAVEVYDSANTLLFSFVLYLSKGHGELTQLKSWGQNPFEEKSPEILKHFEILFQKNTTINSLKLLIPQLQPQVTEPLYQLYPRALQDNNALIASLDTISNISPSASPHLNDLVTVATHLLTAISWNDEEVIENISPVLVKLPYHVAPILGSYVRGFYSSSVSNDEIQRSLPFFSNLESLSLSGNKNIIELSLANLPRLTSINLANSSISNIKLENLNSLQEIEASSADKLNQLSMTGLTQLQSLNIQNSSIKEISGIKDSTKLEVIYANRTPHLRRLSLAGLTELKNLSINDSSIEEISDIKDCPNLNIINAANTPNLGQLTLTGLTQLNTLNVNNSSLREISDIHECTRLETINANKTPNLRRLSLAGLNHLKTLNLAESSIEEIANAQNCTALEIINANKTPYLRRLSLVGLTHLKTLNLDESFIEEIANTQDCAALETINANKTPNLRRLSLTGLNQLKALNLDESSVEEIANTQDCTALEFIKASRTSSLRHISLSGLSQLKKIWLKESAIQEISDLKDCSSLESIVVALSENLKEIDVTGLVQLKRILLTKEFTKILGLESLAKKPSIMGIRKAK